MRYVLTVTAGPHWFRVNGYGLRFVNHRKYPPLHFERAGYLPVLHIGRWCIGWLRPLKDALCWVCGEEIPPPHTAVMDRFPGTGHRSRHVQCERPDLLTDIPWSEGGLGLKDYRVVRDGGERP